MPVQSRLILSQIFRLQLKQKIWLFNHEQILLEALKKYSNNYKIRNGYMTWIETVIQHKKHTESKT